MKTKELPLDTSQDVELTINPTYQTKPFVITGDYAAVAPIAEAVQAEDAVAPVRTVKLPKAVLAAPTVVTELTWTEPTRKEKFTTWLQDAPLRRFDRIHGTAMYQALQEKREQDAQFTIASQYKLIGDDGSLFYKRQLKHMIKGEIV